MGELTSQLKKRLSICYNGGELDGVIRAICEDLLEMSVPEMLFADTNDIARDKAMQLDKAVDRLIAGEPVQYVTGTALFRGLKLKVTQDTLIPRPETSEMIDIVEKDWSDKPCNALDLCTGSGCIAIAMAVENPKWNVTAMDISQNAIDVARENAENNHVKINFETCDLFETEYTSKTFDVITCNPPYILPSEKELMDDRVLMHEPADALFVPEDDPLLFYREAASKARKWLKAGGMIYFEINRALHFSTAQLVESLGYEQVKVFRDYVGNYRFITAVSR